MSEEDAEVLPRKPLRPPTVGGISRKKTMLARVGKKGAWVLAVTVALVGLVSGILLGTQLPDPTASQQYRASEAERSRLVDRDRILQGNFDSLKSKYEDLDSKYTTLDAGMKQREEAVVSQQASVVEAEARVKAQKQL